MPTNALRLPERDGAWAVRLLPLIRKAGTSGLIYVAGSESRMERLARILWSLASDIEAILFPPWDCMPYDRAAPSPRAMGLRIAALCTLSGKPERPWILLTTSEALLQRVPPADVCREETIVLERGGAIELDALSSRLHRIGYREDDRVDEAGEFAIRGQVIDVFPAGYYLPVRIEHAEGRVTGIASYDAATQRRTDEFETLAVRPTSEAVTDDREDESGIPIEHRLPLLYPEVSTLFDYAPEAQLMFEPRSQDRREAFLEQVRDSYESRNQFGGAGARPLPPERLYLDTTELRERISGRDVIDVASDEGEDDTIIRDFASAAEPGVELAGFIREQIASGQRVLLTAETDEALRTLSRRVERSLRSAPTLAAGWDDVMAAAPGSVLATISPIDKGFALPEAGAVAITAADVLGSRARSSAAQGAATPFGAEEEFRIGDAVIHLAHGVGLVDGIEEVATGNGAAADTIRLTYGGDAKLMVPVADIDQMWRYGSADSVSLDRLGSDAWPKRRAKVEKEINKAAAELAREVSERRATAAPKLIPPRRDYERLVARFPFSETDDQNAAVADILRDLSAGMPMDRLVCGDVGFGKTEVALRAAAAVALSGKQVAIAAPTTVLVRQHLQTFRRRFADFGIEVGHLSRLVKPAEAKEVKAGLADGRIRVVIGTHALAGKNVSFADLGLLVVDEEQRFGAAHKEHLRALGNAVHVLTLTATPIPRTMQSALVGLQDVSVLATPPAERQPVRTFAVPFDPVTVREALLRERRRGGQSFVVCPRIEDIEPMAARLKSLVPELETLVAHGKLPVAEIDDTMVRFADGHGDVLLATNIIESGLDVPRANTILVWRAELFGLAQLHQLRGRVGRGRPRGIAYLLTDPDEELSDETRKRLGTLERLDRLGSGFAISAEDLDQRGAGDLLGDTQSGHVKLIGAGLYRRLLERALAAARHEALPEEWTPELNIGVSPHIPQDYVPEPEIRLNLYAKIARSLDRKAEAKAAEEIEDRFGPLPDEVAGLLALNRLKRLCRDAGVARVDAGPQAIALTFKDRNSEDTSLGALVAEDETLSWRGERLILATAIPDFDPRLQAIEAFLKRVRRTA